MNLKIIKKIFPQTIKNMQEGKCALCEKEIKGFKDKLSVKEYKISGLCQGCQDEVFREEKNAQSNP